MNKDYSILMQKMNDGALVKDLFDDFDVVCTDIPMQCFGAAKQLSVRSWNDENGEDAYFPEKIVQEAFDWKIGMACKGDNVYKKVNVLISWLCGGFDSCTRLKLYSSHVGFGRKDCHFSGVGDFAHSRCVGGCDVLSFSVTFRVCDPVTDVVPVYDVSGEVITGLLVEV